MYQTVQKAANDVDECKQMLVNIQRQLDRMEEKQDEVVRDENKVEAMPDGGKGKKDKKAPISSSIKKFEDTSSEDSSDGEEEGEEDEEEEEGPGGRSKVPLVAMAGGAILIGGALQHQLR